MFDSKTTGEEYTLTIINESTLIGCNVHAYGNEVVVKIPEGVKEISGYAMQGCSGVKRIILPKTLRKIGQAAFISCVDLEAVYIPDNVTEIGVGIFRNCPKLKRVHVPPKIMEKASEKARGLPSYMW